MMEDKLQLSVIILTFNEELHVERAIHSVQPIAKQIIIVDSYSTDRTVEIAKELGATVLLHKFVNHAKQFQWALDNLPIEAEWVMRLDADEYPSPALVEEIQRLLPGLPSEIAGVNLKRRQIFMGRWIRHGARYPLILLRIWRTGKGRIEQRWMDEHIVLTEGRSIIFDNDFYDHNLRDISWWTHKHNRYATREALDVLNRKYGLVSVDEDMIKGGAHSQASFRRIVKERIYYDLPAFSGPLLYFLYRYLIRFGFLDGKEGLIYHFLQGFWYRFLVDAKVMELGRAVSGQNDRESRLVKLEGLTGYSLRHIQTDGPDAV